MPTKYPEEKLVKKISDLYKKGSLNELYKQPFLNWSGKTNDTGREYQQVYAQYIYSRLIDRQILMTSLCDILAV